MSHPFDEPLTPEERALADRLARLGPHDGPSPVLDAKILAAAHAAVAPRRSGRWLALTGIPATLVTGAGMAAVLALAVGVVWQLRPSAPAPKAPRDESDFGFVTAEVIRRSEPPTTATAAAAATGNAPPPPPAQTGSPAAARAVNTAPMAPMAAKREAAPDARAPVQEGHFLDEAVDPQHSHPATAAARSDSYAPAVSAPAPAPVFAPAPAPAPASAPVAEAAAESEYRQRAAAQSDAAQRKSLMDDAQARREQSAQAAAKAAGASVAADAAQASDTDATSGTLDRIEVTGSRMSVADLPVRNDRALEPEQWLQRIRDRRDAGDVSGARESLALLRKTHPRLSLPDDLRALADPAR
ncbi:hypothetical protein AB4Y64_03020 [Lysobacter sp. TAF61]|uniref:hypothetical protein n=1 Tax=Lysobacter sp. TAF61 TaxID=3233072 RepID=UPI003F96CDE6